MILYRSFSPKSFAAGIRGVSNRSFSFFRNCSRVLASSRFHSFNAESRNSSSYFIEIDRNALLVPARIGDGAELYVFEAIHHRLEGPGRNAVEGRRIVVEDRYRESLPCCDRTHRRRSPG